MSKLSKKYKEALEMYDKEKLYSLEEAVDVLKKFPKTKFDETVEVAVKLKLNKSQRIRGVVSLPNTFGAPRKVVVIAKGDKATEAEQAGADFVGDMDIIEKIKKGWFDYDAVIATPDMMKDVGKLGPILGRRGLMPNPKTGTVTFDVADAVKEIKKGKYEFRSDKDGVAALGVAKISMDVSKIIENIKTYYDAVLKSRPADLKGDYIKTVAISNTMSPGVKIDLNTIK